jgi:uncharacterized protein YdeI (YjbR/CyaY-like superfamily)
MEDTSGSLALKDRDSMGHLGRITKLSDLPADDILIGLIKTAMKLNEDGVKLPRTSKVKAANQLPLETPDWFTAELDKDVIAKENFEKFSNSHKKEYIEWLTEAKTQPTRDKRMAQAIVWLHDGKSRHWKYQ